MLQRTWKMVEERMRSAMILHAGASGRSRYDSLVAPKVPQPGEAAERVPRALQAEAEALRLSSAERLRRTAEYNAQRDAYLSRNFIE
jgi:hypothetical protein